MLPKKYDATLELNIPDELVSGKIKKCNIIKCRI